MGGWGLSRPGALRLSAGPAPAGSPTVIHPAPQVGVSPPGTDSRNMVEQLRDDVLADLAVLADLQSSVVAGGTPARTRSKNTRRRWADQVEELALFASLPSTCELLSEESDGLLTLDVGPGDRPDDPDQERPVPMRPRFRLSFMPC